MMGQIFLANLVTKVASLSTLPIYENHDLVGPTRSPLAGETFPGNARVITFGNEKSLSGAWILPNWTEDPDSFISTH